MYRRSFGGGLAAMAVMAGIKPVAGAPLRDVNVNYGVPQIPVSTAPIFAVPIRLKLYEREGFRVTGQGAQGAGPALQQLIAGQVALTFTGLPAAMELINKGAPIKIVASVYRSNVFYPVVLLSSGITDIAGLKGKTVGVTGIASTNTLWLRAIMRSYGVADDDVKLVGTGDGASALAALMHGQVDALQLVEADYDRFETTGVKLRRLDAAPILQKLSFVQGLVASQRQLDSDPAVIGGLLRAIAEAAFYSEAHTEDAVRMQWTQYPESKPQGSESKALADGTMVLKNQLLRYTSAEGGKFGSVAPNAVELARDTLVSLGQLSKALPADRYYTDQFVQHANDFDRAALLALPPAL
jgi:NitT/TauT family transport system substrate-binding protein